MSYHRQKDFEKTMALAEGYVLFCYAKGGRVRCLPLDGDHDQLKKDGWKHTMTIDPAKWIETLMEGHPDDAVGMMDEMNFGPNVADVARGCDKQ